MVVLVVQFLSQHPKMSGKKNGRFIYYESKVSLFFSAPSPNGKETQ